MKSLEDLKWVPWLKCFVEKIGKLSFIASYLFAFFLIFIILDNLLKSIFLFQYNLHFILPPSPPPPPPTTTIIIKVFLYGDLAIYAVSVPASIQAMTEQYIVGDVDSTG